MTILGGGESGVGAALLALQQGYDVFLSDAGKIREYYKHTLEEAGIRFEEEKHSDREILLAEEVVKSPGIPKEAEMVQKILQADIPVISEIEFASRYTDAFIVGITGSNGKTTTSSLTFEMLRHAGLNVALGGNIGRSFASLVRSGGHEYYVLEISSFQLDDIVDFRPDIAMLLNITPDHLDRYENTMQNYIAAKFRITENQTPEDRFIYCSDDPVTNQNLSNYPSAARQLPFGFEQADGNAGWLEGDTIKLSVDQNQFEMSIYELGLQGKHNTYNSMAAGIVGSALGLRKDAIRESLSEFKNLPHRLEKVATIRDVEYINDSKATNVNSTWYALESMNKPVVWIAGGVDKGNDYEVLKPMVRKHVKAIICLGVDNRHLHGAFSRTVDFMFNTTRMDEAVQVAKHMSDKGDVVLLSPACASFDLFENYEDRGNQFRKVVKSL